MLLNIFSHRLPLKNPVSIDMFKKRPNLLNFLHGEMGVKPKVLV